jgi:hypothetical protein
VAAEACSSSVGILLAEQEPDPYDLSLLDITGRQSPSERL